MEYGEWSMEYGEVLEDYSSSLIRYRCDTVAIPCNLLGSATTSQWEHSKQGLGFDSGMKVEKSWRSREVEGKCSFPKLRKVEEWKSETRTGHRVLECWGNRGVEG